MIEAMGSRLADVHHDARNRDRVNALSVFVALGVSYPLSVFKFAGIDCKIDSGTGPLLDVSITK